MTQQPRLAAPFLDLVLGPVFTGAAHVTKYKSFFYSQPCAASVRYRTQPLWMTGEGRRDLSGCSAHDGIRKQAIELFLDYLVTLANTCLQTGAVQHNYPAPAVVD